MTDLTTLSRLLASQEARNAAPCVPVTGPWYISRNGLGGCLSEFALSDPHPSLWRRTGGGGPAFEDCIWSGDLPALLAGAAGLEAKLARAREVLGAFKRYASEYRDDESDDTKMPVCIGDLRRARTTLQELDQ